MQAYINPLHEKVKTTATDIWNDSCSQKEMEYAIDKMGASVRIQSFPGGQFKLHPDPVPTLVAYMAIVARPDLPDSFVYSFVKMCFGDQNDEYLAIGRGISVYNLEDTINSAGSIPLHNGVIKYLKEIGKWTSDLEARNQRLIAAFGKPMK